MKIGFLQYELRDRMGIMFLSAQLKQYGHSTNVFTLYDNDVLGDIEEYGPEILCLSASTSEHTELYNIAKKVKENNPDIFIILGGPHGTFFPEEIYNRDFLDAVCRGEGERSLPELINKIEKEEDYSTVKGMWVKKCGKVIENEIREPVENLDELPFPDREIYYNKYPILRDNPTKTFILTRGCPFNCTYCYSHLMRKLYGNAKYVRIPSVDWSIRCIKEVQEKYGFKWVQLIDSMININKKWLIEFLERYKEEINVPFMCSVRMDLMDEEIALKMIEAGLDRINFGVECGNEEFRKNILKRNMKNENILKISKIFNQHNIRIVTSNIVGLPGETTDLAFETIELNRKIKPESAVCYVLVPYPKTEIHKYCVEHDLLKEEINIDNLPCPFAFRWTAEKHTGTVIKLEQENELLNIHHLFDTLVQHPNLEPLVKPLLKLPPNRFYDFIGQLPVIRKKVKYSKDFEEKLFYIKGWFRVLVD